MIGGPLAGRPTKFEERFCEMLIKHMSQGLTLESFGGEIGVAQDTLFRWIKQNPSFSEARKIGDTAQKAFFEKLGLTAAVGKIKGFNATAYIWCSKNMIGWRDQVQVTGANDGPLQIEARKYKDLPDKELLELLPEAKKELSGQRDSQGID